MIIGVAACSKKTYPLPSGVTPADLAETRDQDTVVLRQIDRTTIRLIGVRNKYVSYTETIDGYTVMLAPSGVYGYAKVQKDGGLTLTEVKAHDPSGRNETEEKFLNHTSKHLRYSGKTLNAIIERHQRINIHPQKKKK